MFDEEAGLQQRMGGSHTLSVTNEGRDSDCATGTSRACDKRTTVGMTKQQYMAQETTDAPPTFANSVPAFATASSGPDIQHHTMPGHRDVERLHPSLPQRPVFAGYMYGAEELEMRKKTEVCRRFLQGRCNWGDRCRRLHPGEDGGGSMEGPTTAESTCMGPPLDCPATARLPPVDGRANARLSPASDALPTSNLAGLCDPPPATNTVSQTCTIALKDGIYKDRFSRSHSVQLDDPLIQALLLEHQGSAATQQPPNHPLFSRHPSSSRSMSQDFSPTVALPANAPKQQPSLRARPARTLEEDTRPARITDELCMKFRAGICAYGDRCHRAHVLDVPSEIVAMSAKENPRLVHPAVLQSGVELCKLNLYGKCPRVDCRYSHDLGHPIAPSPASTAQTPVPGDAQPSSACPEPKTFPPEESLSASNAGPAGTQPIAPLALPQGQRSPRPKYVVLEGNVCHIFFHRGYCAYNPCKYRHCTPDEKEAILRGSSNPDTRIVEEADVSNTPSRVVRPLSAQVPVPTVSEKTLLRTEESSSDSGGGDVRPADTARKRQIHGSKDVSRDYATPLDQASAQDANAANGGKISERTPENDAVDRGQRSDEIAIDQHAPGGNIRTNGKGKTKEVQIDKDELRNTVGKHGKRKGAQKDGADEKATAAAAAAAATTSKAAESMKPHVAAQKRSLSKPTTGSGTNSDKARLCKFSAKVGSTPQGSDTESDDTDTDAAYYSAQESQTLSAQTSWTSVDDTPAPVARPEMCRKFQRGICKRGKQCRYSHDASVETQDTLAGPDMVTSEMATARNTPSRLPITALDKPPEGLFPRHQPPPLIPPGLGLDNGELIHPPPREELHTFTITVLDSTKVTFSAGFDIVKVTTGFESRQILLSGVPTSRAPVEITEALQTFGEIIAVLPGESSQDTTAGLFRVTFSQAEDAARAADTLNGGQLFGVRVTARVVPKKSTALGGGVLEDGDVLFQLPTPRQIGYVGFATREEADKAIALARTKEFRGMRMSAKIYQGIPMVGAINVRIENMPADTALKDLARFGKYESCMLDRPKYPSVQGAVHALRRRLSEFGEFSFNALSPPYAKFIRVWAHFADPQAAAAACNALHRFCPAFLGKQRMFAHHIKSLRYNLPPHVFDIILPDLNLLRSYCEDDKGTGITVIDRRATLGPGSSVLVKLLSHDLSALSKLKASFDRLLRGEKVTEGGQIVWNDFFGSRSGNAFFDELEQVYPKVRINRDPRRQTLALFGAQPERDLVRAEIVARAELLRAQRKRRYPLAADLLFSRDLARLRDDLGRENVWFDITNRQLVVCGDEDAQKVAQLAVKHAGQHRQTRLSGDEVGCPVCFGDVSHSITLSCGHQWCKSCLTGYLHASIDNKNFPLTCLGNAAKCTHLIPLHIAQRLVSTTEFDAIVNASFLAYIQSRPNEFHYCPTPDCPQVYRKTKRTTVLQCPSCLARICPHCDAEYHESRSCQDRDAADEGLFAEWKRGHDVKDCPSCKVPIERMAGCNHMTCASCKTHICWACLATFSASQDVYDHMRAIHGGIGL